MLITQMHGKQLMIGWAGTAASGWESCLVEPSNQDVQSCHVRVTCGNTAAALENEEVLTEVDQ